MLILNFYYIRYYENYFIYISINFVWFLMFLKSTHKNEFWNNFAYRFPLLFIIMFAK